MQRFLLLWVALLCGGTYPTLSQSLDLNPALKPFYHGVASGDPLPNRVIIWTRVTPEVSSPQSIDVRWQVATDSAMTHVVQSGAFVTNAERDYTVKVDVSGLTPYTTYFYQFESLNAASVIGRTRTAPTADEADRLRFAVVSCSNYQAGYFGAYKKVAERADLDAVIHLGDYIYEYSATGSDFYGNAALRDAGKRNHLPDKELVSLEDYRTRYSQYRLDPDLRAVHQQHPFITIWDDHESANDAYEDGAQNHQPDTEGPWDTRKSVSKQAYAEWIPIRVDLQNAPLYRTIHYGNLVDLIMLDTRLEERDIQEMSVENPELYSAERTILGATQKQWLYNQLQTSQAQWKVIGNQVIFSPFNVWFAGLDPQGESTPQGLESTFLDIWDGYPAERDEIINYIGSHQIGNTVILTGDFHSSFAFDVTAQPSPLSGSDPAIAVAKQVPVPVTPTYDPASRLGSVAVEFATPSVNSANFDENIGAPATLGFEAQINQPLPAALPGVGGVNPNPHMRFNDLDQHGYFVLDVTKGRAQANWYFVNTILKPNSDEYFASAWGANDGEPFLVEGEENPPKEYPAGAEPDEEEPLRNITRFVLVDPATDKDVGVLMEGDTVDLNVLTEGFDVRVIVPNSVSSVQFTLNDTLKRIENVPAYTLFFQQGSNFIGQKPKAGHYQLTATPYELDSAQGAMGTPRTVNFVVKYNPDRPSLKTIVELASETENLSTLVQALARAELTETLGSEGPFTVFAPTNEAFDDILNLLHISDVDRVPRVILRKLLLYHVAKGKYSSTALLAESRVKTLVGLPVLVEGDSAALYINNAEVIAADIQASNGIVHLVDEVVLPNLQAVGIDGELLHHLNDQLTDPEGPLSPSLSLSASPNPGAKEVVMEIEGMAGETVSVQVMDQQGQYLAYVEYTVAGSQDSFTLDLSQYAKGLYIVNAQAGELYQYVRVMK